MGSLEKGSYLIHSTFEKHYHMDLCVPTQNYIGVLQWVLVKLTGQVEKSSKDLFPYHNLVLSQVIMRHSEL